MNLSIHLHLNSFHRHNDQYRIFYSIISIMLDLVIYSLFYIAVEKTHELFAPDKRN
jgi:hypothetical protein